MQLVATFTTSSLTPGRRIVYAGGTYRLDAGTELQPGLIMMLDRQGMLEWHDAGDREAVALLARVPGGDSARVL
jgi:hypothetical protein